MSDLRLYREIAYQQPMEIVDVTGNRTSRLETIANKVVKYILTDRGSDLVDLSYGSATMPTVNTNMQLITYSVSNIISSCVSFIKNSEKSLSNTVEKLDKVTLLSVEIIDRTTLKIRISIFTTFKNYALLDVSPL